VVIDSSVDNYGNGPEVYRDNRFCQKNERALGGVALQKIAAAAGVQIVERKRLDDRSEPYYCEVEITLSVRDYDGMVRTVTKAREIDLRDGAPEAMKPEKKKGPNDDYAKKTGRLVPLDPSALADRRRHIQSLAETKAFHRALRSILQIKQKYTVEELSKPFAVPKLVPALDPSDPDQKRALIASALGRECDLFGPNGGSTEFREMKDVKATVLPPADEPPAETPSAKNEPVQQEFDPNDFEPMDVEDEDDPPQAVCTCPCGCQAELDERVAAIGIEKIGTPRCRSCYPAKQFDVEKHKDVENLEIPKQPDMTTTKLAAALQRNGR
jgi:hypothetical protein